MPDEEPLYGPIIHARGGGIGIPVDAAGKPVCTCEPRKLLPRLSPIPRGLWNPRCYLHRNYAAFVADNPGLEAFPEAISRARMTPEDSP